MSWARRSAWALSAALLLAGCGVGTYRAARVTGDLEMRLVARSGQPGQDARRWIGDEVLTLEREAFVRSEHVREVQLENMPDDTRQIVLHLDDIGTARLAEVTQAHEGRRIAIVVDGRVVVAPVIRGPITEGVANITLDPEHIDAVFDALTRTR